MSVSRPRLTVPLTVLAALALMLTAAAPVLAVPADAGGDSRPALAQPEECDEITIDAEGDIGVGGQILTDAQLALLDADVLAAIRLAGAAQASGTDVYEACVDVEIGFEAIAVNADFALCGETVEVDAEGSVTVDGIEIDPRLLNAELVNLLKGAAAVAEDACVYVEVEDNDVVVLVEVDGCVTATLNENESVSVEFGGVDIELPADAITNLDNQLELGVATATRLFIFAELTLETGDLRFQVGIAEFHFCADPTSGQVVVEKRIDDGHSARGEPAAGWTFDFAITGGEIVAESPTTNEDGLAIFDYTTAPGAVITVTEERRDGYELMQFVCQPISDGGEPLAPIGVWTDISVTFPAEPGVRTVCVFLNTPTGPAPTTAPTGGQVPAINRPTITLPPTDVPVSGTGTEPHWSGLVLVTLGLVVAGTLLLTPSRGRRKR